MALIASAISLTCKYIPRHPQDLNVLVRFLKNDMPGERQDSRVVEAVKDIVSNACYDNERISDAVCSSICMAQVHAGSVSLRHSPLFPSG